MNMPEMTDEIREQLKKYHGDEPVKCGCGAEPVVYQTNRGDEWIVECSHCHIRTIEFLTRAGAVLGWNTAMGEA